MAIRRLVLAVALATPVLLMMARPAAASWLEQTTPPPQGATNWQFSAVSCTSPSSCMAVGSTNNGLLAEQRTGSTWTILSIPGSGQLNGISCASATACEAVGQSGSGVFAERWDGTSWTVQTPQLPTGATSSQLDGVSCTSTTACEAVGQFSTGSTFQTLAEIWNGSTWTIQATQNPAGQASNGLSGVSCISATACEAVGSSSTGTTSVTLAEAWNGTGWTAQTGQTWAEAWNGTTWTIQNTPIPAGGSDPALHGVSCTAPKACTAVGSFFNGTNTVPLADRWNGTTWTTQHAPAPAGSTASGLASVSCASTKASTACNAVGFSVSDSGQAAMAENWNGMKWSVPGVPTFSNPPSALSGVSCSSLTACISVGSGTDISDREAPLAEQYS